MVGLAVVAVAEVAGTAVLETPAAGMQLGFERLEQINMTQDFGCRSQPMM